MKESTTSPSLFPSAAFTFGLLIIAVMPRFADADEVSFSHDILPLLSDRCFHCHGPDESHREAGLRLDLEDNAKEDLGGYSALVPGDLDASELWARITTSDPDLVMPPPDSHRPLLDESEQQMIRDWISSGAKWGKHWSLERIERPELPSDRTHPIDAFVVDRLDAAELDLSTPANPITLLRRLSFDLIGMGPTANEIKAFQSRLDSGKDSLDIILNDEIKRLLNSPHHGERMAMWWLDAARYSDSDGFQQDATRQNWPWRDWVIGQFNQNTPFDQFTIEQFAGDLLPEPTETQKLATCFHRNHMTNGEGGRDPEESRIDYVIDRVNTMGTVWMGLTLGCVQCHSHKFDPITQHEYYSLAAFFNSIDEDGRAGNRAKPYLSYTSPDAAARMETQAEFAAQLEKAESEERQAAEQRFELWLSSLNEEKAEDYQTWRTPKPLSVTSSEGTEFEISSENVVQTFGLSLMHDDYRITFELPADMVPVTGLRLEVLPDQANVGGRFTRGGNGEFALTSVRVLGRRSNSPSEQQIELSGAIADYEADKKRKTTWDDRYSPIAKTLNDDARDGWTTEGAEAVEPHVGVFEFEQPWKADSGDRLIVMLRHRSTHGHSNIAKFRLSLTSERGETVRRHDGDSPIAAYFRHHSVSVGNRGPVENKEHAENAELPGELPGELRARLFDQFLLGDDGYQQVLRTLQIAKRQLNEYKDAAKPRNVMVLAERETPRATHVLVRGVWDAKGDEVQPGVIRQVLADERGEIRTRLDLAQWILDREHPLTARVAVNHLWQMMFGQGLVRTPGDFGLQGELPTHPELLDWLAVELIESKWDLRHVLQLIATSQTYQQSSGTSRSLLELDPENRLLARAPRFRLPSWMIRDNALRVSGLLNPAIGGPPVRPYQPEGVWGEITMGRFSYEPSVGTEQYRRTVYAFWRRSIAPTFLFDSAQRRVCEVSLRRTNTPLQALTLMNDTTILEASRALADRAATVTKEDDFDAGIKWLGLAVLGRHFDADETASVRSVWNQSESHFQRHPNDAMAYCSVGQQKAPAESEVASIAAWMAVANLALNLDEAMTRE
ncbi:PSD1 and planctomycete cytochrome C domain-containing protein [Stieleria sp. JC731]|uniref:PSD1 and planctomycete cytochrome C domain-containing protein n=1 Tax=Pirellulaceae TaxID=2691357 RepID=UPI001E5366CD|nr:PSD1 and planctomycete cytochrome C domain-containing protein [Stieleria sp. JC731]MCC9601824.1 PSD1 and planctomycete cytochrome C domain-containing protein [Stieleria sp. JC731]